MYSTNRWCGLGWRTKLQNIPPESFLCKIPWSVLVRLGSLPLWSHRGGSPLRQVRKAGQGREGNGGGASEGRIESASCLFCGLGKVRVSV